MKFLYRTFVVAFLVLFTAQCTLIDEELLDSPNSVSPSAVNPDFLLNSIQVEARNIYRTAAGVGANLSRMRHLGGTTFGNAYSPESFSAVYSNAYSDLFIDVQNLLPLVDNPERGLYFHAGIARTLKAYTMLVMVDMFGDMPYSEALNPTNFNPGLDDDAAIYAEAIAILDTAILNFQNQNRRALPANDFYFDAEVTTAADFQDRWVRVANTIKLKALLNTGNTSAINTLINDAANSLIVDAAHDFTFDYSTNFTNPDSRHPDFGNNYDDLANSYMAVSYMNMLLNDKNTMDPRMRYYFYRQTTEDPTDVNLNTCINAFPGQHFDGDDPFCLLGDGWWGRDYLINDGIPPDQGLRTTFGVYPVGGQFDLDQGESVDREMALQGAGFEPILMSSYTHFMIAEAQLRLNNDPAAARTFLESAIRESFTTVQAFGEPVATPIVEAQIEADIAALEAAQDSAATTEQIDNITALQNAKLISDTDIDTYVNGVLATYDGGAQLRTIAKEYYFALWPNGYEAFNLMRRTNLPDRADNLQPTRTGSPGDWYRSLLYPANMVDRNSSIDQKTNRLAGPFWDTATPRDKFNF